MPARTPAALSTQTVLLPLVLAGCGTEVAPPPGGDAGSRRRADAATDFDVGSEDTDAGSAVTPAEPLWSRELGATLLAAVTAADGDVVVLAWGDASTLESSSPSPVDMTRATVARLAASDGHTVWAVALPGTVLSSALSSAPSGAVAVSSMEHDTLVHGMHEIDPDGAVAWTHRGPVSLFDYDSDGTLWTATSTLQAGVSTPRAPSTIPFLMGLSVESTVVNFGAASASERPSRLMHESRAGELLFDRELAINCGDCWGRGQVQAMSNESVVISLWATAPGSDVALEEVSIDAGCGPTASQQVLAALSRSGECLWSSTPAWNRLSPGLSFAVSGSDLVFLDGSVRDASTGDARDPLWTGARWVPATSPHHPQVYGYAASQVTETGNTTALYRLR
jgi:hypothetical protein